jgi:oligoendopeptidase F
MVNTNKLQRFFVDKNFTITNWENLKPYYENLLSKELTNKESLRTWLQNWSELDAIVSEDYAWRYIKMTCDTTNNELLENFTFFTEKIEPEIAPIINKLQKKLLDSPFINEIEGKEYFVFLRSIKKSNELFREENIALNTQISNESQKYGAISAEQTIEHEGKQITLQKAASLLKSLDRELRKSTYLKIQERKNVDENKLNQLYTDLIELRHKVSLNAGFKNYRDYKFEELGRFDYTVNDCINFHESIAKHIVPINKTLEKARKEKLNLDSYKPWDTEFDIEGNLPLTPFNNGEELTEKTISCFNNIDQFFGECITTMKQLGHLDLESRIGKAPGGYNYPLYESGVPFIFMNSVGTHRDMVTMVHEGGHAVHSFLCNQLSLTDFKSTPSEVAELASMGMELISMEHWNFYFTDENDLKRAKKEQLEKILKTLPWIACIDKFQHWVYENPTHSIEERYEKWYAISKEFSTGEVDYSGLENNIKRSWQGQLHLYEVPFYYIEYGMAQLGAVAIWKNYLENKESCIASYKNALAHGYTRTIPELYNLAGIKFDFSAQNIKELAEFVLNQYKKL